MMTRQVTVVFVKTPVPGRVKTRLARDIGNEAACALYRRMTTHAIGQVVASGYPLVVCYDGVSDDLPDDWRRPARAVIPQTGTDLGRRMAACFSTLFRDDVAQAVLIGSDIPGIDAAYISQAFSLLADHDLAIGPAIDGGYCLIGFRRQSFTPELFEAVPWSTGEVLHVTLLSAARKGLSVGLLPALQDVDTIDDLFETAVCP
jgi:rSAM/selenodomain-associated transferase 1